MTKIYFLEPSWYGTGLTNEIFFIIYGLIHCIKNNIENLVINNFRCEPLTEKKCNISEVIDLHHLNIILQKYNLSVFDRNLCNYRIESITYGSDNTNIDVTKEALERYCVGNKLFIQEFEDFNILKGDPHPNVVKKLIITCKLGEKAVQYSIPERNGIYTEINLDVPKHILNWNQIDDCMKNESELFDFFLKNIKFNNRFTKYSDDAAILIDKNKDYKLITEINSENKKINVIHLRTEKDMTGHMLSHNNMNQEEYDINLQKKYIELIKKYMSKNDILFILSYDSENSVINYLHENDYEYYLSKKNIFDGREKHAIVDLLLGEKCNNIFIGNWEFNEFRGSTFSYFLYKRNNAIKNIFIDMYKISENEVEISN